MLQVGSFPQVTQQRRSAVSRAELLRTDRTCELVVRHAAKLQDISVIAAHRAMHGSGENHPSVVTKSNQNQIVARNIVENETKTNFTGPSPLMAISNVGHTHARRPAFQLLFQPAILLPQLQ